MLLAARQSHQCHSLKNYLRVPKQWLKKKTNFRDNLFFIVGDKAHAPVINHTHLLTTALLSWGLVPVIPRSFHYWQPAPRWRPLPESPRGREESRHPSHWEHQWKGRGEPVLNWVTMFVIHPCWIKRIKVAAHTKMAGASCSKGG